MSQDVKLEGFLEIPERAKIRDLEEDSDIKPTVFTSVHSVAPFCYTTPLSVREIWHSLISVLTGRTVHSLACCVLIILSLSNISFQGFTLPT